MDNDVLTTLKILISGESGVGKSRYKNRFGSESKASEFEIWQ